jgi:hypothetical protein
MIQAKVLVKERSARFPTLSGSKHKPFIIKAVRQLKFGVEVKIKEL